MEQKIKDRNATHDQEQVRFPFGFPSFSIQYKPSQNHENYNKIDDITKRKRNPTKNSSRHFGYMRIQSITIISFDKFWKKG